MYPAKRLGQWGEIAAAAAGALTNGQGRGGGAPPSRPTGGGAPTFQQQFTPQASPVFTQVQDSPGSTQVSATTQYAPGGQTAQRGAGSGGLPLTPLSPPSFSARPTIADPAEITRSVFTDRSPEWRPWVYGAAIVAALLAFYLWTNRAR